SSKNESNSAQPPLMKPVIQGSAQQPACYRACGKNKGQLRKSANLHPSALFLFLRRLTLGGGHGRILNADLRSPHQRRHRGTQCDSERPGDGSNERLWENSYNDGRKGGNAQDDFHAEAERKPGSVQVLEPENLVGTSHVVLQTRLR